MRKTIYNPHFFLLWTVFIIKVTNHCIYSKPHSWKSIGILCCHLTLKKKIWVFLNSYSDFSFLIRNKCYLPPKTTHTHTKSLRKYNFQKYLPKLTAEKIIYTHSQITMGDIPKIISTPLKKKKSSKCNHNQI